MSAYSKKQRALEEVTLNKNKSSLLPTEAEIQLIPLVGQDILTFFPRGACRNSIYHIDPNLLNISVPRSTGGKDCSSCSPQPSNRALTNQHSALLPALREVFAFFESRQSRKRKGCFCVIKSPFQRTVQHGGGERGQR